MTEQETNKEAKKVFKAICGIILILVLIYVINKL